MACGGFFCQPQQPVLQAGETIAFGVRPIEKEETTGPNILEVIMAIQINYEGL